MFELYIGNKCFSSWSLRPWLALKHHGIAFTEKFIRLRQPDTPVRLVAVSPSGRVPVLHHDGRQIWDTLAILEYLAELFPEKGLWPTDRDARAVARSVSAEMHSGFVDVRNQWGMNLRRPKTYKPLPESGQKQTAHTQAYVDTILSLPAMKEWYAGAAAEPWPEPRPDE